MTPYRDHWHVALDVSTQVLRESVSQDAYVITLVVLALLVSGFAAVYWEGLPR